jgi:Protein of unknown function (DUF4231)
LRETFGFTKPSEEKTFDDYVQGTVEKLNKTGNEYAAIYHTFTIMVLVASAIVPVINAVIESENPDLIKRYTSILAFIGAISVGILQITQARERWTLERVTKVTIERERNLYNNNARPYEAYADMDSTKRQLYVERVMRIIMNKFNRFYAIGRPSGQEDEVDEDRKKHPESAEETKPTRTPLQNKSQNGGKDDGVT